MKRSFSVRPRSITASSHAAREWGRRADEIRQRIHEIPSDSQEWIDLNLDLAEAEANESYAWQDDEDDYLYAYDRQEFNPDGSLAFY